MDKQTTAVQSRFAVTGMSCAACAQAVEGLVARLPGIEEATVNYGAQSLTVVYHPAVVDAATIESAVLSGGYGFIRAATVEAEEDQLSEQHRRSYRGYQWRVWFSLPCAVVVALLSMGLPHLPLIPYLLFGLTALVLGVAGAPFFINGWRNPGGMDALVALSTGTAFLLSAFQTFFPGFLVGRGPHGGLYYESAVMVIAFVLLGRMLEQRARWRTADAIRRLIGMQPGEAQLVRDGRTYTIPVSDIQPGDTLLVRAGDRVPVDGHITTGMASLDMRLLTGEPMPALKAPGDKVWSGTAVSQGWIHLEAEKTGSTSTLARLIAYVRNAQEQRAPVQALTDRISAIFVPLTVIVAVLTFGLWLLLGGISHLHLALQCSLSVLVIACPCALGLAVPTALMVGLGKGAGRGILIRAAGVLEAVQKMDVLVVDKTGTLTVGEPDLVDACWKDEGGMDALVSLSLQSGHPLSRGILRKYGDLQANVKPVEACSEIPGKGITGLVDGIPWWVGSRNWLEEAGFLRTAAQEHFIRRREKAGDTLVCLGHKGQLDAVLAFNDVLRPSAPAAVVALQQAGIRVVILSGDHAGSVGRVAEALGISEWRGEQTPQGKADYIRQRQASGEKVGMAGDGINDAPALAVADLSIAMSSGAGVAMDVADITLMNNDLLQIQQAIRLSAMTTKTIRQNLFWAFAYNGAAVPLAAGVLYPLYGITLNPAIAGAAMALSSLTVVLNSLRLRQQKL